jgi:hypothetical protein
MGVGHLGFYGSRERELEQGGGLEAGDVVIGEGLVGGFDAVFDCDGAAGVLEDQALEAEGGAVEGGEADTEVVGEAGEEETLKAALAKISGETGGGLVVVFAEGRVGVDVGAEALAEDELGVGEIEAGMEGGAVGVLQTVVGPEGLGAVGGGYGVLWVAAWVRAGEGDVASRVPVLGEEDVGEAAAEAVDEGDDLVAVLDGEMAAGTEVVLQVDDEESVGWTWGDRGSGHEKHLMPGEWAG